MSHCERLHHHPHPSHTKYHSSISLIPSRRVRVSLTASHHAHSKRFAHDGRDRPAHFPLSQSDLVSRTANERRPASPQDRHRSVPPCCPLTEEACQDHREPRAPALCPRVLHEEPTLLCKTLMMLSESALDRWTCRGPPPDRPGDALPCAVAHALALAPLQPCHAMLPQPPVFLSGTCLPAAIAEMAEPSAGPSAHTLAAASPPSPCRAVSRRDPRCIHA